LNTENTNQTVHISKTGAYVAINHPKPLKGALKPTELLFYLPSVQQNFYFAELHW